MVAEKTKASELEISVEEKLRALYELQKVDSEVDKIRILRGELPLEVEDLEDEIAGLVTRIGNYDDEVASLEVAINNKKGEIKNSQELVKKYKEQQENVRNNREFESLAKEVEFQTLEVELCEKRIREFSAQVKSKKDIIADATSRMEERNIDLTNKKKELDDIVSDTRKEEEQLMARSEEIGKIVESRLIIAYQRIRSNARNGLAVVTVQRDACGGCYAKIPPQRQLDIQSRKKIIVCEYCGRILVDSELV